MKTLEILKSIKADEARIELALIDDYTQAKSEVREIKKNLSNIIEVLEKQLKTNKR